MFCPDIVFGALRFVGPFTGDRFTCRCSLDLPGFQVDGRRSCGEVLVQCREARVQPVLGSAGAESQELLYFS